MKPHNNPFSGRGTPVSGSRLVGRKLLLDKLLDRVISGAHCSIVGLPRMGKTSVAKEVLNNIRDVTCGELTTGYITLDAIRGPIQAYARILEEIVYGFENLLIDRVGDHDEAYEDFRRMLRNHRRSGGKSLIVIDEIDAVTRKDFLDAQLFISRIRELANDIDRYGLTFVFISRRSLDRIQGVVDCSTLAGLCEVFYLKPLDNDGLNALASRSPIPVNAVGREALWSITGGHPFLAEVVMCEVIENQVEFIDNFLIEEAQAIQSHEFTNQYRQWVELLSHDKMFEALCELAIGPRWQRIDAHVIALITHYGLLRKNTNELLEDSECMSNHFRCFLELLTRTTPSWVLLGEAERQLRYFIQDQMTKAYGEDWLEKMKTAFPNIKSKLENLSEQKKRETKMFGNMASNFILDYAYIGDLKDMVFADWDKYRTLLRGPKKDWEKVFQDITKARNPMAHHRRVPADILYNAECSCKILLEAINANN